MTVCLRVSAAPIGLPMSHPPPPPPRCLCRRTSSHMSRPTNPECTSTCKISPSPPPPSCSTQPILHSERRLCPLKPPQAGRIATVLSVDGWARALPPIWWPRGTTPIGARALAQSCLSCVVPKCSLFAATKKDYISDLKKMITSSLSSCCSDINIFTLSFIN